MSTAKTGRHAASDQKVGFWQIYAVAAAVALVIIGAMLGYLWQTLREYEASTQTAALNELTKIFTSGDYEELATRAGIVDNPYEDSGSRQEYFSQILAGGEIQYAKLPKESTAANPVYLAKAGDNPIGAVSLVKSESGRFGRWYAESIEVRLPAWGNVVIRLPGDAELTVNGRVAREADLYAIDLPYAELANLPDSAGAPKQKEYRITGLFQQPEIRITAADGSELAVAIDEAADSAAGAGETSGGTEGSGAAANAEPEAGAAEHLAAAVLPEPAGDLEKLEKMAVDDAKTYSLYLTSDYKFGTFAKRMIKGSTIYKNMQIMETVFYTNHYDVKFSDEKAENIRAYSEDIFAVDVDYTYTVFRANQKQYPFHTRLTFYYVKDGGDWKIGDILIR